MSNFELIDDYLTNRLSVQEKIDFEQRISADPSLKADLEVQKNILEGIKKARIAELKTLLNNVPVGGFSSGLAVGKMAATLITAGVVGTSLYFYFKPTTVSKDIPVVIIENIKQDSISVAKKTEILTEKVQPAASGQSVKNSLQKKSKSAKKKDTAPVSVPPQPKIEVVDPSDELTDNLSKESSTKEDHKSTVTASHVVVEINSVNKKYNFHYQFVKGKLVLFGSFDKSLYEILEIHGDSHTVFLFFNENYYLLDEKQNSITVLEPIKDAALLKKLREYRGR